MKRLLLLFGILFLSVTSISSIHAQTPDQNTPLPGGSATRETIFDMAGSALLGGVTIDGENYQQLGARFEFNLYKLGIGLDIQLLIDEDGKVRAKDWDNWEAYLDKIYYLSWGKKGDPFYVRYGGLEYTYLGYSIMVDGYSNMIEYPTYKRQGMELSFDTKHVGGEFLVNDFKELWHGSSPSVFMGGRLYYKVIGNLSLGLSIAGDLNEYKGLRDSDGDGYPDEIDGYPENGSLVTEQEYYAAKGALASTITDLINNGLIDSTDRSDLTAYGNKTSRSGIWAADIGFPLIKGKTVRWEVYSQFAQIFNTGGYGFSLPGTRLKVGPVTLTAEYKHASDKFLFGYYNKTYELERSSFVPDGSGNLTATTKIASLEGIKKMNGFLAGIHFNILNFAEASLKYQALFNEEEDISSINGEVELKKKLIPKISTAKAFYTMNNVQNFNSWKTPGTIMGAVIGFEFIKGTSLNLNYLITFQDRDGDGKITRGDEKITRIGVSATSLIE